MKVMYNSRRANDALIERTKKSGKLGGVTFGQKRDPCVGIFGKVCLSSHSLDEYQVRHTNESAGDECLPTNIG